MVYVSDDIIDTLIKDKNNTPGEQLYLRNALVKKDALLKVLKFVKQNNLTDERWQDIVIQKYRYKQFWKDFNEDNFNELKDYLGNYISDKFEHQSQHRLTYIKTVISSLIPSLVTYDTFDKMIAAITVNKYQPERLLSLYQLCPNCNIGFRIQKTICQYVYSDFNEEVFKSHIQDNNYKVDAILCRPNPPLTFSKLMKELLNMSHIHFHKIDKILYSVLKFDEYKYNFNILASILYCDGVERFLSVADRKKHFEQLLKTATYKRTKVDKVKIAIKNLALAINEEEQEALDGLNFLITL